MTTKKNKIKIVYEDRVESILLVILVSLLIIALVLSFTMIYKKIQQEKEYTVLTPQQVGKMIEGGFLKLTPNIKYTPGDKNTEVVLNTIQKQCHVFQDPLGRYYCRWTK